MHKKTLMLLPFFAINNLECGTDEAGRGCLAGPVTAAAVILPRGFKNEILTDSKLLNEKTRIELRPLIEEQAITFSLTYIDSSEIDSINILNASIKAMQESKSVNRMDKLFSKATAQISFLGNTSS